MVQSCDLCGGSGANRKMISFPANSKRVKQDQWIAALCVHPEVSARMIGVFRETLSAVPRRRVYWCQLHFDASGTPTDHSHVPINETWLHPQPASETLHEQPLDDDSSDDLPPALSRGVSLNSMPSCSRHESTGSVFNENHFSQELNYIPEDHESEESDGSEGSEGSEDSQICSTPDLPPYLLVSSSCLLTLFTLCPKCGSPSIRSIEASVTGSALVLKWECDGCVKESWNSQERLNGRFFEGNVKFSTAAHTTGLPIPVCDSLNVRTLANQSQRVRDFAEVMGLAIPKERTIHHHILHLVLPAVDEVFTKHLTIVQNTVRNVMEVGRGLDLSADGRYDSPGYSASNLTVSFIDLRTNLIVLVVNMHKKMKGIDGKSGRMEKEGVREGLKRIQALQFKIRSICTDNDAKISKMLREDPLFKDIKHLLDFWHLIKSINHALREIAKKKNCPNVQYWRRIIINHAYFVHFKYAKSRQRGYKYWLSVLAHVTGRHAHFHKVPFLHGINKCKHKKLGKSKEHLIKRDSPEFQELKAVIMKPTFHSGFLRASPKTNTSPNECFNSIVNLYAPKRVARSHAMYDEILKLVVLHYNTLSQLNLLNLRKERWNSAVNVIGRDSKTVKRKMTKANHAWRQEIWEAIPGVIEGRKLQQFMKRHNAPTDREYLLAMQQPEEEEGEGEEGEKEGDGAESDVSEEIGGGYGEEVDSDRDPEMKQVELSGVEDEESEEEEEEEEEVEGEDGVKEGDAKSTVAGGEEEAPPFSGSDWDEGEAAIIAAQQQKRGGGKKGKGNTVAQPVLVTDQGTVASATPLNPEAAQPSSEEPKKKEKKRRARNTKKSMKDDSESDPDYKPVVAKREKKGHRENGN